MENRTPACPREDGKKSAARAGLILAGSAALHAAVFAGLLITPGLIPPPREVQVDEGIPVEVVDSSLVGRRVPIRLDSMPMAAANPDAPPAATAPAPPGPDAAQAAAAAALAPALPQAGTAPAQDPLPSAPEATTPARDFAQAAPPPFEAPPSSAPEAPAAPQLTLADASAVPATAPSPEAPPPAVAPAAVSAAPPSPEQPGRPNVQANPAAVALEVPPPRLPDVVAPAAALTAPLPTPSAAAVPTAGPQDQPTPASDRTVLQAALGAAPADPAPPRAAPPTDTTALAAVAPPMMLRPLDPKEAVEAALAGLECSRVSASVDPLAGTVSLKGHARSEADRRRLVSDLGALAGVQRVDDGELRVLGEPYCRLLAFLDRPDFNQSSEQRQDLATVGATNQPANRRAAAGRPLDLTLSAPEFDAFLYVDQFSGDGKVTHLLPTERPDNFLQADARFQLGPRDRGRWAIPSVPNALEVILVLASSEPIFVRPRPMSEDAASYIKAVDERIRELKATIRSVRFEYSYILVATEPPRGSR